MPAAYVVLGVVLAAVLVTWGVRVHRAKREARRVGLQRLGFTPCPDRKAWLEAAITSIEQNRGYRYAVSDPWRLTGSQEVYYYTKTRHGSDSDDSDFVEEEILFRPGRAPVQAILLIVKPSSIGPGLASRALSKVATGSWDSQPDGLERVELPPDLKNTNLLGALAPPGARLYDLVDAGTLSVVQRIGDLGGLYVMFRDGWCAVGGGGRGAPFRVGELIACVRPLF